MSATKAKPAEVADYDSDESRIVSGTEVSAAKTSSKRRGHEAAASSARAPRQAERCSRSANAPKPASDSGYSSTPAAGAPKSAAAATNAASQPAPNTSQKAATGSPAKTKPIIHRADSARSTTRSATVSNTTAKRAGCHDPNCRDVDCESKRNPERRSTNPHRMSMPQTPTAYSYQQQYDYAAMPPPSAIPRQRADSMSRPRPQSFHAPAGVAVNYALAPSGPPPSASAYYGYPQGSYGMPQASYGSTGAVQPPMYAPPSPAPAVPPSPSSPITTTYPGFPGQTTKISARTGNPAVPGLANSIAMPPPAYNVPAGMSARGERRNPVPVVANDSRIRADEYTSSSSESSEEESEDERHYERYPCRETKRISYEPSRSKSRRRGSTVVIEDPRRPAATKSYTTSALPTRRASRRASSSRPDLAYRTNSDPLDNYVSSDHYDSGATAKAVIDRKHLERRHAVDRHSRRPSVASSYDTPPTSLSSGTAYGVVEDEYGRRRVYLSQAEVAALTRQRELEDRREGQRDRLEEQLMHQARIERYQRDMSASAGVERQNLTATNIKQASRTPASHVSARSHKSTVSGSKLSRSGGLMIESNGTLLYLEEGIQEISLKADDGGNTRVVIGSGTGRETSYHGSKSSGSRVGRPRTSRAQTMHEGGYEKGL